MIVITNAFSINMLQNSMNVSFTQISLATAKRIVEKDDTRSAVGHADIAAIMSSLLGIYIPASRSTIEFSGINPMLVGQYRGPRLPEGATSLPENANVEWWLVEYLPPSPL